MIHFHVFLPPPVLVPLQANAEMPALRLKILRGTPDSASQGSSLRSRIPLSFHETWSNPQAGPITTEDAIGALGKRKEGPLPGLKPWDNSIENDTPGPSKRPFTPRLATQNTVNAPFPTMPFPNDVTDSFLSLNTTTSNPSQFPPTAENRADTSISNLPRWHIPLAKLSTLQSLLQTRPRRGRRKSDPSSSDLISVLVCVTAVEAPVVRQRKEEKTAGREGTLWISRWGVVAPPETKGGHQGSEDEVGCDVKLWEDCAKEWGSGRVRRGDVVLLQGVQFKPASTKEKAHLVVSSTRTHSPTVTVVYRTLPRYGGMDNYKPTTRRRRSTATSRTAVDPQDKLLRPDLRLGRSDAGIRKVAEVARWFAEWVGGEPP